MEHIRQFDWCSPEADIVGFVNEDDLDNCVTERILRNKFRDPLIYSDTEEESSNLKINWDEVFSKNDDNKTNRIYVPGLRALPPYPKLSALTVQQHYQCLKVLCAENPNVLEAEFVPRPTKQDHRVFEEVKQTYANEQKEYIEWAKSQWLNGQCARALRPKPEIEMVYEAEFEVKTHALQSFPKTYWLAAQIPLETRNGSFEITLQNDLKNVNVMELPQIQCPDLVRKFNVMKRYPVPEPCNKHPSRFILPTEDTMSILPLEEVHRELAQYALDYGASYIASESALKCLVEQEREWAVPLSVCTVIGLDGNEINVVVMGSEFPASKQSAPVRTYRAFKHLLEYSLIPETEKLKRLQVRERSESDSDKVPFNILDDLDLSTTTDDENEDSLFIDTAEESKMDITESNEEETEMMEAPERDLRTIEEEPKDNELQESYGRSYEGDTQFGRYECTCKDTSFSRPPARSFRKWQVKNSSTGDNYDIIVHCSHKIRSKTGEVILEPIPEYQIDLGGCELSQQKIRSLALSLYLRKNASLLNVRIDSATGEIVTYEYLYMIDILKQYGDVIAEVSNTIHTAINQLQGLLPGRYILKHESNHGCNAILYAPGQKNNGQQLVLDFSREKYSETDDTKELKTPPALAPVLLPIHKFRKILPCAFTPNENQVAKETKKPGAKQKTPPQAIKLDAEADSGKLRKWPKRKRQRKKKLVNGQE